jgi:outer membrane protein assembly factor BamA
MKRSRTTISLFLAALLMTTVSAPAYRGEGQPVLGVAVFGNYGIDRALITREFGIAEGDTCSYESVQRGLRRVEALHGVSHASHKLDVDDEGRGVFIMVTVTEERAWRLYPLANRNFADRIAVGAAFHERNLRGKNEELYLSAMVHGAVILRAGWTTHRTFGAKRLSTGIRLGYRGYDWPYPSFDYLPEDGRISWFEGYLTFTYRLTRCLSVFLDPGADYIDSAAPAAQASPPDSPSGWFSTLSAGLDFSRIDRTFYPGSGLQAGVSVKKWGLAQSGPALDNTRLSTEVKVFLDLGWPLLSVDARSTLNRAGIPYYLYEHLGGVRTIRGHEFGVYYGENSALVRTDLRLPLNFRDVSEIGNPIFLVDMSVFVDTGAAWGSGETISTELFYSGAGVAMSLIPKEGWLLKFGHAWPMDPKGRWFFDIGTMF